MNQSNNPPIPTSSSYSFGGSGAFGAYFLAYLAGLSSFFSFGASWTGAWVRASSSGILNLNL